MDRYKRIASLIIFLILPVIIFSGCSTFMTLPNPQIGTASKIYDSQGKVITTLYRENRIQIPISQIPEITQNAFIAVEDARFYHHIGIDPVRIIAAAWNDLKAGKLVEGGSTITQQTVKTLYLSRKKTFGRKLTEALLAIQLERKYTKKQILEMYLNQIYFGQGAYGIETAAETYFDKPASKLDLAESALLAGLPKAPNTYNPFQNWEGAKQRQHIVLNRMVDTGFISRQEADQAGKEKLILKSGGPKTGNAPYFVNEIVKYITENYDDGAKLLFSEGISVYTTLDLDMQKAAEEAFSAGLAGRSKSIDGALIAIDPADGYVKAMVGGRDFSSSKFNRAVQAHRQPGSAFKPFLYAAAMDKGYTEGSTLTCEAVEFPQGNGTVYRPTDYGTIPYHNRPFTLREALATSDNIVAVKLANEIGPSAIVDYAHRMGVKSKLRPYLSLALGTSEVTPLELTSAYGTLAAQGMTTKPMMVVKIVDKNGNILEQNQPVKQRAISETTAYLVTDMLTAVLQPGGTAGSVAGIVNRPAAGKTGTTQDYHDAWFIGYTPNLAAGVYIGYDNPNKSVGATGGTIAAPIWAKFVAQALKGSAPVDFSEPPGIVKVQICADSGLLATPYSTRTLPASFLQGTEPTQYCNLHSFPSPGETEGDIYNRPPAPDGPNGMRRRILDWFFRRD